MKQSQRIVKNAVLGIAASVIGGAVYLATVLTIAHKVSVVEFGSPLACSFNLSPTRDYLE